MRIVSIVTCSVFLLPSCAQVEIEVPRSTFYERSNLTVDGRTYTVVTNDDGQHFIHENGLYYPCAGPNADAEGCAGAIDKAKRGPKDDYG